MSLALQVVRRVSPRKLREARVAAGLSTTKLADIVGVNQSAISQYEDGRKVPNVSVFAGIACAVKLPMDDLVEPVE